MQEQSAGKRRCKWDRTVFLPVRSDQRYCSDKCRKSAHRFRVRTTRDGELSAQGTGLSVPELLQELADHCELSGRPSLIEETFLRLYAEAKEAEEQIRRWGALLQVRKRALERLARPRVAARVVRVTSDGLEDLPHAEETLVGIACSSPELAIVVYGRPRSDLDGG